MKILMIGDVVGNDGIDIVKKHLKSIKKLKGIDFCIANGENSASGKGINKACADSLLDSGVDVITMGNHTFDKQDIFTLFEEDYPVMRPANMPPGCPGEGYILTDVGETCVCVINACGRIFLDNIDCPFRAIDSIIKKVQNKASVIFVDFHAEATSEKLAMGKYLDGRVSAVVGTHTHIPTADEKILKNGTAYITDVGMTGTVNGIIGVKSDIIIGRFISGMPARFELAEGNAELNSIILEVDENTGRAQSIERFSISG